LGADGTHGLFVGGHGGLGSTRGVEHIHGAGHDGGGDGVGHLEGSATTWRVAVLGQARHRSPLEWWSGMAPAQATALVLAKASGSRPMALQAASSSWLRPCAPVAWAGALPPVWVPVSAATGWAACRKAVSC